MFILRLREIKFLLQQKIRLKYQPNSNLWTTLAWFSMHSWFSKYYYLITTILAYWQKCTDQLFRKSIAWPEKGWWDWLSPPVILAWLMLPFNSPNSPRNLLHRFSFQSFKEIFLARFYQVHLSESLSPRAWLILIRKILRQYIARKTIYF